MLLLAPDQRRTLNDVLVEAFDLPDLTTLVRYNLPHRLDVLVDTHRGLAAVVFDLVEAIDRRGELEPLLRGAVLARPNHAALAALCRRIAPQVFDPVDTAGLVSRVTGGLQARAGGKDSVAVWGTVGGFRAILKGGGR